MSQRINVSFVSDAHELAGIIEVPVSKPLIAYAIFAHCFTCGKDSLAAARISRSLVALGYGVLRFDFAGLGASEGDFSDTNFSTKVNDLLAAARFLSTNYQAPSLMIGHSLGGRAAISAAKHIPECKAVVTIGSPANPSHVLKQFHLHIQEIQQQGEASVLLAGRPFNIKKQFLDDIAQADASKDIETLGKPLLIFHSPTDETVSIEQAAQIYQRAKHPKSFISLDNANHLLTGKADAEFVATMIHGVMTRYMKHAPSVTQSAS